MTTPSLIDAARWVDRLFSESGLPRTEWVDARHALAMALTQLPPDAVIVSHALSCEQLRKLHDILDDGWWLVAHAGYGEWANEGSHWQKTAIAWKSRYASIKRDEHRPAVESKA